MENKKIKQNKSSLYIDGKMEYQAVNLLMEYGCRLDGCKYAVASRYTEEAMIEKYADKLKEFVPFIYLTEAEYQAIYESQKNEKKYQKRQIRNNDAFSYSDELTEIFHDLYPVEREREQDPSEILFGCPAHKKREAIMKCLQDAMETVTEKQLKRLYLNVCEGKSFLEIGRIEGVDEKAIRKSVEAAKSRIEKKLKKFF